MNFQKDISLKPYNTFQLESKAKYFIEIESTKDLLALIKTKIFKEEKSLVIGGGSNMLLVSDFDGLVIKNSIKGKTVIQEDKNCVWLKVNAGENWHEIVTFCVNNEWGGIENLALIPGCVGAAPIQNIGAYGVELKDVFDQLAFFNYEKESFKKYGKAEVDFGYRNSIFKRDLKGKGIITSVVLRLNKKAKINVSYGAIKETLAGKNISLEDAQIKDVYQAVIDIRSSKLPDPKVIGNSGSFFKNPELPTVDADKILAKFPGAPHYIVNEQITKIPAGWMIDQCGWKGFRDGDIGVHDKQALVLVNHGNGKGSDIKALAHKIQASVKEKFGVELVAEVNMI